MAAARSFVGHRSVLPRVLRLLGAAIALVCLTPVASAQSALEDICFNYIGCWLPIAIMAVVFLLQYFAQKKARSASGQYPPSQMGGQTTYQPPAPAYSRQQGRVPLTQSYHVADTTPTDFSRDDFLNSPIIQVQSGRSSRKAAVPAGMCPRCGSRNLLAYGTGENRCNDCKKVFYVR